MGSPGYEGFGFRSERFSEVLAGAKLFQPELFHFLVECRSVDPEPFRGLVPIEIVLFQDPQDDLTFRLFQSFFEGLPNFGIDGQRSRLLPESWRKIRE